MPGVIDDRRWLRLRIEALEEALSGDLPAEQRPQLEAELAEARSQLRQRRKWVRRLLWGASN